MQIEELNILKSIIESIYKGDRFSNNEPKIVDLYNSLLKLYNSIDIIMDLYSYDLSKVPEYKKQEYNVFINYIIDTLELDKLLLQELSMPENIVEKFRDIF